MPKKAFKVQTKATNAFFRQFRAQWTLKNQKSVYILPRYANGKKWLPRKSPRARKKRRKQQSISGSIFMPNKPSKVQIKARNAFFKQFRAQ